MHWLKLRLVLLAGSIAAISSAQGPAPVQLSLQDAVSTAVKNHPRVLESQANVLRSDQVVREQRAAYYPAIYGDITGSQANVNSRVGAGFLTDSRLFNRFGAGVTLSQLITDSGRTPDLVASAKLQAAATRENARAAEDDVVLNVEQAYYAVLLAQNLLNVSNATVRSRQAIVDQVNELVKNKLKSSLDLDLGQVNLADAKLMMLRAQANLTSAYAALSQALGSSSAPNYKLADQPLPPAPPSSSIGLIKEAFGHRPEVAGLQLQEESNEKFAHAESDLRRPTVTLAGVAGGLPYINRGSSSGEVPKGYEGIALNVQIPVFNGHLFAARARAAALAVQASQQRTRELQNAIARDVRSALARVTTAYAAIPTAAEQARAATSALDLATGRYNLGLSSIVELTQAQFAQTQAQVLSLNSKYEYEQAYAELQYTIGLLH